MTDQELKELIASNAVGLKELRESQKQTDEQMKKTDEQMKKTDEQIKKTDEQIKKTDEQMKKTDEKLDRIAKTLGAIGNNQGDVAEEYFQNSLAKKLKIGQLKFDYMISNYTIRGKNIKDEYDILLESKDNVAIIEVKYKVHKNDVKKLTKKIENFKKITKYQNYKLYVGIAGFYVPQDVIDLALENGYFVLQRKGKVIESFTKELKAA